MSDLEQVSRQVADTIVTELRQQITDLEAENARLRKVESAARPIFDLCEESVAGWQHDPEMSRHPDALKVSLNTNCGTVYAIADALAARKEAG